MQPDGQGVGQPGGQGARPKVTAAAAMASGSLSPLYDLISKSKSHKEEIKMIALQEYHGLKNKADRLPAIRHEQVHTCQVGKVQKREILRQIMRH